MPSDGPTPIPTPNPVPDIPIVAAIPFTPLGDPVFTPHIPNVSVSLVPTYPALGGVPEACEPIMECTFEEVVCEEEVVECEEDPVICVEEPEFSDDNPVLDAALPNDCDAAQLQNAHPSPSQNYVAPQNVDEIIVEPPPVDDSPEDSEMDQAAEPFEIEESQLDHAIHEHHELNLENKSKLKSTSKADRSTPAN